MEFLVGHPVRIFTDGFNIVGRWMRLAQGSIRDLVRYGGLPPATDKGFWRLTGLIVITPYHNDERLLNDSETSQEDVRHAYLEPLRQSLEVPIARENAELVCLGQAGVAWAIQQATHWMTTKRLERLIVVAADSYCDPLTLDWLSAYRRLKTPDNPCGLAPGEAGAAFLLEAPASARRRQPEMRLAIDGVATAVEPNHFFTRKPIVGVALSEVLAQTLVTSSTSSFKGDLVSDLNGENWRAREMGNARVRLADHLDESVRVLMPATSVGDTGAASGALSLCVAARAIVRGYARTGQVLVATSSERGHVGALILRKNN
ncbi:hypothetical protein [Corallococcus macrosporus]|nr:hypothetical protein [Corallococcus macrosporus]